MSKKKEKTYDVVDLYKKLKKHFPHLKFVTEDIVKGKYTFHNFQLKKYNGQVFDPPVKTTISVLKNNELTKNEYRTIRDNVALSFPRVR